MLNLWMLFRRLLTLDCMSFGSVLPSVAPTDGVIPQLSSMWTFFLKAFPPQSVIWCDSSLSPTQHLPVASIPNGGRSVQVRAVIRHSSRFLFGIIWPELPSTVKLSAWESRKLHRCTLMIGDGLKGPSWLELGHFIITSICSLHGPAHIALWSEPWKGCCKETSQVSPLFLKRASKAKKNMSEVSVELTCPPVQWVGELDEAWCGCTHRYLLWILAAWNFLCHQSHLVGLEAHRFLGKFGRWKSLHPVFGSLSLEEVGSLYLSPWGGYLVWVADIALT